MTSLSERFNPKGPKRMLALDGGGIRGALTLGYLKKIEDILRVQHGNKQEFRLCHYFDLIGGTSTGSIIAACLAIGKSVEEVKDLYFEMGGEIFGKKYRLYKIFKRAKAKFNAQPLDDNLRNVFKDYTMGSDEIKTGLCIVAKRADTNSIWPLINHPDGKFFDSKDGTNKDIPLWKAVRASTAAPTYFLPQIIDVGGGMPTAAFIDGGISIANNPSLQLLMVATLKGFPFHWNLGEDNMLLVSVGTGYSEPLKRPEKITKNHLLKWAKQIPDMMLQDTNWHNQIILQWISNTQTSWYIDTEIEDMKNDLLTLDPKRKGLVSYIRYNTLLEKAYLNELMHEEFSQKQIENLLEMSNGKNRYQLYDIGHKAAAKDVLKDHFPEKFKI